MRASSTRWSSSSTSARNNAWSSAVRSNWSSVTDIAPHSVGWAGDQGGWHSTRSSALGPDSLAGRDRIGLTALLTDAAAQQQQARVLAEGEGTGSIGGWPRATELVRLVVLGLDRHRPRLGQGALDRHRRPDVQQAGR